MDEIDLGLHELSNQLSQEKTLFVEPKTTTTGFAMSRSQYVQWMKTYFFYWASAVFLFVFILWSSPEYCYLTVDRPNQPPTRQFLWSRFMTVFAVSYSTLLSLYLASAYLFRGASKIH